MFYEELRDIEVTEYITERDIKKLDEWLVRTPMRNRKNLKSDSFAEAEGVEVNDDNTLILFSLKARSTQVPSVKKEYLI